MYSYLDVAFFFLSIIKASQWDRPYIK